jgi:hypothetical protein
VHYLADRGGLVCIAGLDSEPPDLLLGALLVVARQLSRMRPEAIEEIRKLGEAKLTERGAEKRAWRAYERASQIRPVYLSTEQLRALISALGRTPPAEESELVPALVALLPVPP